MPWLKEVYSGILVEQCKNENPDFGAWKEASLSMLESSILRKTIRRLTLANDSMNHNKRTPKIDQTYLIVPSLMLVSGGLKIGAKYHRPVEIVSKP